MLEIRWAGRALLCWVFLNLIQKLLKLLQEILCSVFVLSCNIERCGSSWDDSDNAKGWSRARQS